MSLSTRYMGLELASPLIASASPVTAELDGIRRLEDAGAGAVVLPSIFQERIEMDARRHERLTLAATDSFPEAQGYFPYSSLFHTGPQAYLSLIRKAREAVAIPVVASLNGTSGEGWISYAREIEQAGADAVELNIYSIPSDLSLTGRDVEQRYLDIVRAVRSEVRIPVAVKLGPYFSAFGNVARQLDENGADALVLFNRFYQPDIDLASLRVINDLTLSDRHEIRLPLLWISLLSGQVRASLAASSGVENAEQVIKYLLAGADVVMTASALLRFGPGYLQTLRDGLLAWMEARGVDHVSAIRGSLSRLHQGRRSPLFERGNHLDVIERHGA